MDCHRINESRNHLVLRCQRKPFENLSNRGIGDHPGGEHDVAANAQRLESRGHVDRRSEIIQFLIEVYGDAGTSV